MLTPDVAASPAPQSVSDVFLAYGLIGAVALILLGVVGYLYRAKEQQRDKYEAAINAQREKHDSIVQKLNEDRIAEMKTGMVTIADAIQSMEKVTEKYESNLALLLNKKAMS